MRSNAAVAGPPSHSHSLSLSLSLTLSLARAYFDGKKSEQDMSAASFKAAAEEF